MYVMRHTSVRAETVMAAPIENMLEQHKTQSGLYSQYTVYFLFRCLQMYRYAHVWIIFSDKKYLKQLDKYIIEDFPIFERWVTVTSSPPNKIEFKNTLVWYANTVLIYKS